MSRTCWTSRRSWCRPIRARPANNLGELANDYVVNPPREIGVRLATASDFDGSRELADRLARHGSISRSRRRLQSDGRVRNVGLFRTILAGSGHTLADAFAKLEQAPEVEHMTRHPKRGLLGARVTLPPDEGEGYWDLTRIRDDIYVVVANFTYKDPRVELVPGDGLVQFNFKLSGDMSLAVSRTEPLRWNRPSLLVWAQPRGIDISEWTAPSARERFIIISIRPEFLAEHFLSSADAPPAIAGVCREQTRADHLYAASADLPNVRCNDPPDQQSLFRHARPDLHGSTGAGAVVLRGEELRCLVRRSDRGIHRA